MTKKIIWIKPKKGGNISIGREKIANELRKKYKVNLRSGINSNTLRLLLFDNYDCLVGTTRVGAIAGLIAKLRGKKVVIDHVDPIEQFKLTDGRFKGKLVEYLENLSFRFSDSVLITNEEDEERVRKRAKKVIKAYLGVDYERFAHPNKDSIVEAKKILGYLLEDDGIHGWVITYIGGLEPIYNLDKLILAMQYLPNWRLFIVGSGSFEKELIKIKLKNDIDNVHFLGSVDYNIVPGILYYTDVCVTLCETHRQVKILEYAASRKPVVAPKRVKKKFRQIQATDLEPSEIASKIKKAKEMSKSGLVEFQKEVQEYDYERIAILYESAIKEDEAK